MNLIQSANTKKKVPLNEVFWFQEGPGIRNWQYTTFGVKFINIRCIEGDEINLEAANFVSNEEAFGKYSHFLCKENDILVSTSGTLGRNAVVRKSDLPLCMNTSVIRFEPKKEGAFSFMFCYLNSDEFKNNLLSMASGSAQLNFGPMQLNEISLELPNDQDLLSFNRLAGPLLSKALLLLDEIKTLRETKKFLLSRYF